jgi:hypothetical protein
VKLIKKKKMSSPTIEKGEIPALLERWSREARKELDVRAPSLSSLPTHKKKQISPPRIA